MEQRRARRRLAVTIGAVIVLAVVAVGALASGLLSQPSPSQSAASPDGTRPSAPASPNSEPSLTPSASAAVPTPAGPAIVPGAVDRTSIDLIATYEVDVDLGFERATLRLAAAIEILNASGDGIDRVELNTITGPLGRLRLGDVRVDGRTVQARVNDQTILVPLDGVLPDGASATISLDLRARLRSGFAGSDWLFTKDGGLLQASRWLPWVGLHRPFDRPNHGDPFFTQLSPLVRVRFTTDVPLVIAAPGEQVESDGLSQAFEARNVRDFPIVAGPAFEIREQRVEDWTVRLFALDGFPADEVLRQASDGLARMSRLAGNYPYPTLVVAQTGGGYALEGPGMIWIPRGMEGTNLRWNVFHEVAHQWFYGLVGSDHALDPFADEAMATHLGQSASGIWRRTDCAQRQLDLSIYRYSDACYFGQIYLHGAGLMERVRRAMGSATYWRAIRAYVAEHRFGIGSTRAILETLQAYTNVDLTPILAPRFPSLF